MASPNVSPVNAWATATGCGSWPGTSVREPAEIVAGELPMPYLVELPARGVGADLIGRAAALLVDIAVEVVPTGYRIAARPGSLVRRARSFLDEDLDALEEAWERGAHRDGDRTVKVQAPGPVTLAAQLELSNGHRAITDPGAVRDLTASLAEGIARHRALVSRRLGAPVVVQLDEPSLPAALAGRLSGASMFSPVRPIEAATAVGLLNQCSSAVDGDVLVHCCAAEIPWEVLKGSDIRAVALDAARLADSAALDGLASVLDNDMAVMLGVVPSVATQQPLSADVLATRVAGLVDDAGFPRSALRDRVGVSPACGLAGATLEWASTATELTRKVGELLEADPDAL